MQNSKNAVGIYTLKGTPNLNFQKMSCYLRLQVEEDPRAHF